MPYQFPWPDADLNPNKRIDRRKLISAKAAQKKAWWAIAMSNRQSFKHLQGSICLKLTFCPPDKRRRDLDNLHASVKHGLDGLALALGIDDARFEFVLCRGPVAPGGRVEVAVGVMVQFVEFKGQIS